MFSARWNFSVAFRPLTDVLLFLLKNVVGLKYHIIGLEKLREAEKNGPVIVCCNHQSTWETFIFSKLFSQISVVIKKELLNKPIAGVYFKRLGCIPIDRSSPINAIKSILKHGEKSIKNGISILIFPNGTRASASDETEYKSGVYALYKYLNVQVVPATVDSGEYWPCHTFKKKKGIITLRFGDRISPGKTKEDFFELLKKV
jgi:1-acyl-sn-glycerol-3-phosphate acyltransferase